MKHAHCVKALELSNKSLLLDKKKPEMEFKHFRPSRLLRLKHTINHAANI
jgi:hypothetical protein